MPPKENVREQARTTSVHHQAKTFRAVLIPRRLPRVLGEPSYLFRKEPTLCGLSSARNASFEARDHAAGTLALQELRPEGRRDSLVEKNPERDGWRKQIEKNNEMAALPRSSSLMNHLSLRVLNYRSPLASRTRGGVRQSVSSSSLTCGGPLVVLAWQHEPQHAAAAAETQDDRCFFCVLGVSYPVAEIIIFAEIDPRSIDNSKLQGVKEGGALSKRIPLCTVSAHTVTMTG